MFVIVERGLVPVPVPVPVDDGIPAAVPAAASVADDPASVPCPDGALDVELEDDVEDDVSLGPKVGSGGIGSTILGSDAALKARQGARGRAIIGVTFGGVVLVALALAKRELERDRKAEKKSSSV